MLNGKLYIIIKAAVILAVLMLALYILMKLDKYLGLGLLSAPKKPASGGGKSRKKPAKLPQKPDMSPANYASEELEDPLEKKPAQKKNDEAGEVSDFPAEEIPEDMPAMDIPPEEFAAA